MSSFFKQIDNFNMKTCTTLILFSIISLSHTFPVKRIERQTFIDLKRDSLLLTSFAQNYNIFSDSRNIMNHPISALEKNIVQVAGGTFEMGCTWEQRPNCFKDEKPKHEVHVSSFGISKYEVTQIQWETVMGENPSEFQDCPNCPVESVTYDDVQKFLHKLNHITGNTYRLPTEAEWEFAARGGNKSKGFKYSGSDNINEVAWYREHFKYGKNIEVGLKKPNELGLYDMSGNVSEWCCDWFGEKYYKNSRKLDPKGPKTGDFKVARGGNLGTSEKMCRIACRCQSRPDFRRFIFEDSKSESIGFRIVLSNE